MLEAAAEGTQKEGAEGTLRGFPFVPAVIRIGVRRGRIHNTFGRVRAFSLGNLWRSESQGKTCTPL